jgi:hypothetical protein
MKQALVDPGKDAFTLPPDQNTRCEAELCAVINMM